MAEIHVLQSEDTRPHAVRDTRSRWEKILATSISYEPSVIRRHITDLSQLDITHSCYASHSPNVHVMFVV